MYSSASQVTHQVGVNFYRFHTRNKPDQIIYFMIIFMKDRDILEK